jgi:hypothetical protein
LENLQYSIWLVPESQSQAVYCLTVVFICKTDYISEVSYQEESQTYGSSEGRVEEE